ncbi:MAG: hypothetical protein LUF04_04530, partial [Bacteroides sp.]|nr:hypothetical protein [Bacteroides sp.]
MQDFDFVAFKKELKERTIESWISYRQTHEIGRLRGFACYTDEAFMSLSVFIDTRPESKGNADEASYY